MKDIDFLVDKYYTKMRYNCDRTMLLALGELFEQKIDKQVIDSAVGQHVAGIRKQCGFVEGTLMFIGIYFAQMGKDDKQIGRICKDYMTSYIDEFEYPMCSDIRTKILKLKDDNLGQCADMAKRTIKHSYEFINKVSAR